MAGFETIPEGFYGSIQVRADDSEVVLPLVQAIAKDDSRFLCGPSINGWVGVYPSGNGQDERFARALAESWPGELFFLAVHDDDIFIYRYFRAGKQVDAYWSAPGYFGDKDREEQEKEVGDPEAYAHLIKGGAQRVRSLLRRSEKAPRTFELERLLAFARLLGIRNAGTAYEYLEDGERRGIRGWREFVHVPDRADERSAARRAKAARNAEHKRLMDAGVLLAVLEVRGDRIATARTLRGERESLLMHVRGRQVPIAFDKWRSHGVPHPDGSCHVKGIHDGILITMTADGATRSLLGGTQTAKDARASDRTLELWMLAPSLVDVTPGQALAALLRDLPAPRRATVEHHLRRVLPPPPWNMEQAQCLAQLVAYATSTSHGPYGPSFSRDGRWLACNTSRGLQVAAWKDVLATPDGASIPWRYAFEVPPRALEPNPRHGSVCTPVQEPGGDCVLFAGIDGRLRSMSLSDGHVDDLLELYGRAPVLDMKLLDPTTLAMWVQPGFPVIRAKEPQPLVYVWDLEALRATPGIRPVDPPLEPHALVPIDENVSMPPTPAEQMLAALQASHAKSPREIHLEPVGESDWPDAETKERLVAPLIAAGFRAGERFVVPELQDMLLQFFVLPDEPVVGTLQKISRAKTWLTLSSHLSDGRSFAVTSRPAALDSPPGRDIQHLPNARGETLLEWMRRSRPPGPWLALTLEELPERYLKRYAENRAWREERGFTLAEAARFLVARSRTES